LQLQSFILFWTFILTTGVHKLTSFPVVKGFPSTTQIHWSKHQWRS